MWFKGSTPKTTSSGTTRSGPDVRIWPRLAKRFPWESIAATEDPAVPLVNMSSARVSSGTSATGTGSASKSSSKVWAPSRS